MSNVLEDDPAPQNEESLSASPPSVALLLQNAIAHHSAGRLPQADDLYRQILRLSPSHPVALHHLGVIALQSGDSAAALHLIDHSLQANPDYAEAHFSRGNALFLLERYRQSVECFDRAIRLKPNNAEAYFNRGNTLYLLRQFQAALESFDKAILYQPDLSQAYYNRGNTLYNLRSFHAALHSFDKAIQLRPDYAEAYNSRGGALHMLTLFQAALDSFEQAIRLKPDYTEAQDNLTNTREAFRQYRKALDDYEKALRLDSDEYRKMIHGLASIDGTVERIAMTEDITDRRVALDALPADLVSHPAICNLRKISYVKTEASGKDLVFYCPCIDEIWSPDTASAKGIGGSEEAVIWLSNLLHRRGWRVTVYANCGAREQHFNGVSWKPYWMWNPRDKQNVTVLWRFPQLATHEIDSQKVFVDLHDTIAEYEFTPERLEIIHKIFVKSRFHRSLYPRVRNQKFDVIANGIDAKLFEANAIRDPLLMINTSSADRSLEAFLDCFEEIKKQVPQARAQWAYGWGVWDSLYSSDAQRTQWKAKMQERMKHLGVQELGRLSHQQIAQLYLQANIFAYPTEFSEIDCISLSKAMAAGAIPITTDFAAMGEKSRHGGVFIHSNKTRDTCSLPHQFHFEITDPEQKAQFIREAVRLLLDPPSEAAREPMRQWARSTFDWNKIADAWNESLTESF